MDDTSTLSEHTVLYTARTHTTGGREGHARSDDGRLDVKLDRPGSPGNGTNPEQLFAAGWSACFEGAMAVVARKRGIALPRDVAISAEVDLRRSEAGYSIGARMDIVVPGLDRKVAQDLVDEAHEICPYSVATRGNVDVEIKLI